MYFSDLYNYKSNNIKINFLYSSSYLFLLLLSKYTLRVVKSKIYFANSTWWSTHSPNKHITFVCSGDGPITSGYFYMTCRCKKGWSGFFYFDPLSYQRLTSRLKKKSRKKILHFDRRATTVYVLSRYCVLTYLSPNTAGHSRFRESLLS